MATVTFQAVETGQTTLTKPTTWNDADFDAMVAAYQVDANASINATATRAQVLNYIIVSVWVAAAIQKVREFRTVPASVPAPITVT